MILGCDGAGLNPDGNEFIVYVSRRERPPGDTADGPLHDRGAQKGGHRAGALSVMLQSLTRQDDNAGKARMHRLRHQLLRVPARVIHYARSITLRLPQGDHVLAKVLSRLRELPRPGVARPPNR